jgi:hypothetical protein
MADLRAQIEAVTFQPVPGGYVFREPFRLSSKAQHYLVNDAQKAQLVALTIPRRPVLWQVALWGTLCAMVAIACVAIWLYTGHGDPTATDTIGMIVLTIAQILVGFGILRWWKLRRLRPVLATLQPTDLRLTQSAMRDAAANVMSGKQLVIAGVSSTFAATAALVNGAIQIATRQPIGLLWIVISLVFAGLAALWFTRLLKRAETTGSR